jgi:uracil-DNA glycosylase
LHHSRLNEIPIYPFRINCWFEYEHRRHDSTTPLEQEIKCASLILLSQVRMVQQKVVVCSSGLH